MEGSQSRMTDSSCDSNSLSISSAAIANYNNDSSCIQDQDANVDDNNSNFANNLVTSHLEPSTTNRRDSETYVAVKGQSLIVPVSEGQKRGLCRRPSAIALQQLPSTIALSSSPPNRDKSSDSEDEEVQNQNFGSISPEKLSMSEIERNLQQMTKLLREEDTIKLVVRLESLFHVRTRYLVVVSCMEQDVEEFCLLGVDCQDFQGTISLGLVLAILSHTTIRLDGDGGFCITDCVNFRSHIFKPVSVQTLWSILQSLYRASECAKKNNSYLVSAVKHYESIFREFKSDASCQNEWNLLPGVETRRPTLLNLSPEEINFQHKISWALREILLSEKDLDEITSKEIRTALEKKLNTDLSNYKSYMDEEMIKILGQMEAPAQISDNLFLGTEWNASHEQDLFDKEIGYILNVTSEIDNFFPDTFRYMNIPVSDSEDADILRFFNDSYRFISEAKNEGKNVLVHCKMGISRSATIVIAYVMKNRNMDLLSSYDHVKEQRNCVKPNPNFMRQLEIYEGILSAKRFSNTLEKRFKSESNLKKNGKFLSAKKDMKSSSNEDLNLIPFKSSKKYYNTVPIRLKHLEKKSKESNILFRPKSCTCVIFPSSDLEEKENRMQKMDNFLPKDLMDTFEDAVERLERKSLKLYAKKEFKEVGIKQLNRFSNSDWDGSTEFNSTEFTIENLPLNSNENNSNNNQESIALSDNTSPYNLNELTTTTESNSRKQHNLEDSNITRDDSQQIPTLMTYIDSDPETPINPLYSLTERLSMRLLKSCRRPLNGHTFSVSPNQILNISFVGSAKYSVRHLVNEFELQSNRKLSNLTLNCEADISTTSSVKQQNSNDSFQEKESDLNGNENLTEIGDQAPKILVTNGEELDDKSEKSSSNSNSYSKKSTIKQIKKDLHQQDSTMETGKKAINKNNNNNNISKEKFEKSKGIFFSTTNMIDPHISPSSQKPQPIKAKEITKIFNDRLIREKDSDQQIHKNQRSDKEGISLIIGKLSRPTRRFAEIRKIKEKLMEKGSKTRTKTLDKVKESLLSRNDKRNDGENRGLPASGFKPTGVVKKRLETFEDFAKSSSPNFETGRSQQLDYSTSDSELMKGSKSSSSEFPLNNKSQQHHNHFHQTHRRKSSLPQQFFLGSTSISNSNCSSSSSGNTNSSGGVDSSSYQGSISLSVPFSHFQSRKGQESQERKGSLDSNSTYKVGPRNFHVRGFQSVKPFSSNNRIRGNLQQQQHSTHPLKILPTSNKLSPC